MQSVISDLLPQILPLLLQAAGVCVLGALGLLLNKVKAKFHSDLVDNLTYRMRTFAKMVVDDLENTIVADLKAAAADGKLDDGEKARIKAHAIAELEQHFGLQGLKEFAAAMGYDDAKDLRPMFSAAIESAVNNAKAPNPV